jgi:hypothetical protein
LDPQNLKIILAFSLDDQAWIRRSSIVVPKYWAGHSVAPAASSSSRGASGSTTAARRCCAST